MKTYLIITGLLFALTSLYGLSDPVAAVMPFDIRFDGTEGFNQMRGTAGVPLATGLFLLAGAIWPKLAVPSVWMVVVTMLGLEGGRLVSGIADGAPNFLTWIHVGFELLALVPGALVLWGESFNESL